mgnify:CR=1 FL=1
MLHYASHYHYGSQELRFLARAELLVAASKLHKSAWIDIERHIAMLSETTVYSIC